MSRGNKNVVPEAREALDRFKMEAASEVGVNLKQGYNGDLTSKQAGSVGGQMVNNIWPVRKWSFERMDRNSNGHKRVVTYECAICV
jgi:hypothetical protein